MVSNRFNFLCHFLVESGNAAGVAKSAQVLGRIERVSYKVLGGANWSSVFILASMGLGAVFHNADAFRGAELFNLLNGRGQSVNVNRNNRFDVGILGQNSLQRFRVHESRGLVNVHKNGSCSAIDHALDGGEKANGANGNLVAGTDVEGLQSNL